MSQILLSIKPKYVKKIFDGTKKYEFRRKIPRQEVNKIIIYASSPTKKILGEAEVLQTITMEKEKLWETTLKNAGIDKNIFFEYFNNCKFANAFVLGKIYVYSQPKSLEEYSIKQPPQSFVYLH